MRFLRLQPEIIPPTGPERDRWVRELCTRMAAGAETAFNQFFDAYADRVYRLCLVLTRGREDLSRELQQAVMIRSARATPQCATEQKLWAWLSQVARNCMIDHLRREQNESFATAARTFELERQALDSDAELVEALNRALQELSPEDRNLLDALYDKRMTHKMVAQQTATTPKAVENRIARLRFRLRDAILKNLKSYALF